MNRCAGTAEGGSKEVRAGSNEQTGLFKSTLPPKALLVKLCHQKNTYLKDLEDQDL